MMLDHFNHKYVPADHKVDGIMRNRLSVVFTHNNSLIVCVYRVGLDEIIHLGTFLKGKKEGIQVFGQDQKQISSESKREAEFFHG